MSVIIHAGPPKTGTSSFQSALWRRSNLGTLNAYYPIHLDINSLAVQLFHLNNEALDSLSSIYQNYLATPYKNLILSAENFSDFGYIDSDLYNHYQRYDFFVSMRNIFVDEEIILLYTFFTKDHYKRMGSMIIEAVKHGKSFHTQSIFEYIQTVPYFSAQKLLDNVVRIFQPAKVEILILESFSDIFTKTSDLFGLQFPPAEDIPILNVSPSCGLIYLLHQVNTRMIAICANLSNKELEKHHLASIETFVKFNTLELNDKSYFDFLHINSRQELFSLIDPRFTEEQNQLIDYISLFTSDLDDYMKKLN